MPLNSLHMRRAFFGLAGVAALLCVETATAWVTLSPPSPDKGEIWLIVVGELNTVETAPTPTVAISVPPGNVADGVALSDMVNKVKLQLGVRSYTNSPYSAYLRVNGAGPVPGCAIPIGEFGWDSVAVPTAPAGTTVIASQSPLSAGLLVGSVTSPKKATDVWAAGILTFKYLNTNIYTAGVHSCVITFTASDT